MGSNRKRRGRHEGTLRQRADGRWEARKDVGVSNKGRRIQAYAYGRTKVEALEALAKKTSASARAAHSTRSTLGEYLESWLEETRSSTAYKTYLKREGMCRRHIFPYVGGVALTRLRAHHVIDLIRMLEREGVGAATRLEVHKTLAAALNTAVRRSLIPSSPIDGESRPKAPRKPICIWSPDEAKRFLEAAADSPYYALYLLALTTGMRQGELFGLEWRFVDLEYGRLRVVQSLTESPDGLRLKAPKTAAGIRTIELPAIAVEALRAHPRTGKLVFTSPDGAPIRKANFLRRSFYPLMEKAAVHRISFHALRHTSNTLLLLGGVSPNVVAQRMGHSSTRMTLDVYGHVLTGAQRVAADLLDGVFGTATPEFAGHLLVKSLPSEP